METIASLSLIPTGIEAETPVIGIPGFLCTFPEDLTPFITHEVWIDYNFPFGRYAISPCWSAWGLHLKLCLSRMGIQNQQITFVTESMGLPMALIAQVPSSKIIVRKVPLMGQQRQLACEIIQGVLSGFDERYENLRQRSAHLPADKIAARLLYEYALQSNIDEQRIRQFKGDMLILPYESDTLHPEAALEYLEQTAMKCRRISLEEVPSECRHY